MNRYLTITAIASLALFVFACSSEPEGYAHPPECDHHDVVGILEDVNEDLAAEAYGDFRRIEDVRIEDIRGRDVRENEDFRRCQATVYVEQDEEWLDDNHVMGEIITHSTDISYITWDDHEYIHVDADEDMYFHLISESYIP